MQISLWRTFLILARWLTDERSQAARGLASSHLQGCEYIHFKQVLIETNEDDETNFWHSRPRIRERRPRILHFSTPSSKIRRMYIAVFRNSIMMTPLVLQFSMPSSKQIRWTDLNTSPCLVFTLTVRTRPSSLSTMSWTTPTNHSLRGAFFASIMT